MATISVSEARQNLQSVIESSRTESVFLEKHGRLAAVVLSPERYEQLMEAFEDAEDLAAYDEAMAEEGDSIPWDLVKRDLGWT